MDATVSLFQTDIYQIAEGQTTWQRGSWKLLKVSEKSMAKLKAVLQQSSLMCWLDGDIGFILF